jgi:uncharacterized membrane protein
MWLGIICGALLGAAFGSIPGALVLAILGGAVGRAVSLRGADAATSNSAGPEESKSELQVLQEQMRQANRRIDLLEMQLREAGIIPELAAGQQAAGKEQLPEAFLAEDDGLAGEELAASAAETAPIPASETDALLAARTLPLGATGIPIVFSAPEIEPSGTTASGTFPNPRLGGRPAGDSDNDWGAEPPTPVIPPWLSDFAARWITGGNPLVKVGVLILFLGLAFLLRFVAENTVVPIELRYAGVAAAGIALLLSGWRWRNRQDSYGLILQGAGIGVLYLTTLAGMKLNPLIPPEAGFAILTGVAIFAVLLAVLQDSLALAVAASLSGFAAPVLASSGGEHHLAFFAYLTVLNLAIAAIAWFKAWRLLNLIGFVSTVFLAGSWGEKYYQPALFNIVEPFLLALFVLYVLIAFLFARRTLADAFADSGASFEDHVLQTAPQVSYVDASLVFGVPMSVFGMQYMIVRSFENGPAFSALGFGLAYIFLAYALFRRTGMRYALLSETMIALAVIFGSLSIPLGLEGKWTSAAWAVEAAGMYWVGIRQQKIHARLFALLLLFGSAAYFVHDLTPGGSISVLGGSWLGCLMLALSTWWFYRLMARAPAGHLHAFEHHMRPWLVACGCLFTALMPFLLYPMNWASTLLAILGALAVIAARPMAERLLIGWGCAHQVLAGALYLSTLQLVNGGTVLASGWSGLATAGLIGLALLAAAWGALRPQGGQDGETDSAGGLPSLVLLGGLLFINLAPLFVLPWHFAAMVWPATGIATLWWAIRSRRRGALAFALGLQLVAGAVSLGSHLSLLGGGPNLIDAKPFLHSGFWSPLLIAVAAFAAARLLHRRLDEPLSIALGWGALSWSAVWWAFAWEAECGRLLPAETAVPSLIGVTVITAGLWGMLAKYGNWRQLGQATIAYLPVLAALLAGQLGADIEHPLAGWGALLWPLALLMHGLLLRGQKDWLAPEFHDAVHAAGAWLFVVIAALEIHWHLALWGGADSAWSMLGWLLAPLAYLWAVSSGTLRGRWPLRDFRDSYAIAGALPVVIFLLGWTWQSSFMGDGAAPLPHVPLLNPLETGQAAVLLAIALWWRSLLDQRVFQENRAILAAVVGATAFVVISSMVLRACHLWGGVAWDSSALQDSMLVQTSLSIVWGTIAIGLMLFAHRIGTRWIWIAGAALVAAVVGKLFLVELAAHGSVERIVSFIAVGLLLLLVGYFAPLPPRHDAETGEALEQPAPGEAP